MAETAAAPVPLLTTSEAAAFLRLAPQTLRALRSRGGGPVFCRLSANRCAYDAADIRSFIESKKRNSTWDPGPGRAA
jgi:hypothetical protein